MWLSSDHAHDSYFTSELSTLSDVLGVSVGLIRNTDEERLSSVLVIMDFIPLLKFNLTE